MTYYTEMKFPDFEQRDWPKLAYPQGRARGKPSILCQNQAEYDAAMGAPQAPAVEGGGADGTQSPKDVALAQARLLGINAKGTWGLDRINAEIAAHAAGEAPHNEDDDG